jgi:hypothetical protein
MRALVKKEESALGRPHPQFIGFLCRIESCPCLLNTGKIQWTKRVAIERIDTAKRGNPEETIGGLMDGGNAVVYQPLLGREMLGDKLLRLCGESGTNTSE